MFDVLFIDNNNNNKTYSFLISDFKNWNNFEDDLIMKFKNINSENKVLLVFETLNLNKGIWNRQNIVNLALKNEIGVVFFNLELCQNNTSKIPEILKENFKIDHLYIPSNFYDSEVENLNFKLFSNYFQNLVIEFENFATKYENIDLINLINNSDFDLFYEKTGLNYAFSGVVGHGKALGRTIGFPTANLIVELDKMLSKGVYAVKVQIEDRVEELIGMACYWENESKQKLVEVNIFDFNQDIYGKMLSITPIQKIRNNRKMNDLNELVMTLENDRENIKKIFE